MGKVIIKALAGEAYVGDECLQDRSTLDGIYCQDEFVEYMHEDFKHKLSSGYMDFRFENDKLWTYVVYSTREVLTEYDVKRLGEYTQGQLSDGIGEGFEQFPCDYEEDGAEVYLSPWYHGQKLEIKQIWEGKEV
jgi:hypothetical protein